jgi:cytoskeletal protein CcmA (bactofilin family)
MHYPTSREPGERIARSLPETTIIAGEVRGDLHGTNVLICERAQVTGDIVGEEIVIRGFLTGSVRGGRVMLQRSSHVEGDIFHNSLSIEEGAHFEGESRNMGPRG